MGWTSGTDKVGRRRDGQGGMVRDGTDQAEPPETGDLSKSIRQKDASPHTERGELKQLM